MSYEDREAQIKELSDRKQNGIARSVALNNAVDLLGSLTAKERSKLDLDAFVKQKFEAYKKLLEG